MEGVIILAILVLGGLVVMPIAAFVRASRAVRDTERLRGRLAALESDLRGLTRQFGSQPTAEATPEAAAEATVPDDPSAPPAAGAPEFPFPFPIEPLEAPETPAPSFAQSQNTPDPIS